MKKCLIEVERRDGQTQSSVSQEPDHSSEPIASVRNRGTEWENRQMVIIDKEKCIGCGLCVKVCHNHCVALIDDIAGIKYELCDRCTQCIAVCPQQALSWDHVPPVEYDKMLLPSAEQLDELFKESGRPADSVFRGQCASRFRPYDVLCSGKRDRKLSLGSGGDGSRWEQGRQKTPGFTETRAHFGCSFTGISSDKVHEQSGG